MTHFSSKAPLRKFFFLYAIRMNAQANPFLQIISLIPRTMKVRDLIHKAAQSRFSARNLAPTPTPPMFF